MNDNGDKATTRLLHPDLLTLVPADHGSAPDRGAQEPRIVTVPVTTFQDVEVGVWGISPGVTTDTEDNEIFLVLAGTGRVAFEDGSSIDLRPGVLVRLVRGDRTTWTIHEPLRKLYLA